MKRRSGQSRNLLKRGLILCEGETEENYFKGLVNDNKHRDKFASISVDIYKPKNHSPTGLVEEAKDRIKEARRERNEYDFIWIVFDKDGHENIPKAFNDASSYGTRINIAFTVICFEFFVLLHFEKTMSPFRNCKALIKELKKHLPDYEKASNLYVELKDRMEEGIRNGKWSFQQVRFQLESGKMPYELSAFSNVHQLVEFLFKL
ncbi:MAG: RloB family protein [Balneolaceae bacterium]